MPLVCLINDFISCSAVVSLCRDLLCDESSFIRQRAKDKKMCSESYARSARMSPITLLVGSSGEADVLV
jgi:hypothetical protein